MKRYVIRHRWNWNSWWCEWRSEWVPTRALSTQFQDRESAERYAAYLPCAGVVEEIIS